MSWKLAHRPTNGGSGEWETSTIAIVELDDGPWVYTTIEGEVSPPLDQPVRVRFERAQTGDRFPVFRTHTADGRHSAGSGRSWVRSSLHLCEFLEATETLDAEARSLIRFAIRWAPFGGATAEELLVTCGVSRWRFVQMIRDALRPSPDDSRKARALKRNLLDALSWAWRAYPDSSTSDARG
ncbi:OB-fold domain-containing protein [Nocardia sp. NBC_00508]|uniref:hypothetical protein n=1 Tax=Nocardia sp. NBC_00508 TaxID=2975992 RepID=UPI002E81534B|nr:hypothetical protein [Nocardia sp. NBC_00508]WUD70152.1 OB-fold domain-containing protein [Nocardia sp. NBC_00508]